MIKIKSKFELFIQFSVMMKILVADNNKTITRIMKTALEEEGYNTIIANSIDETRQIILNNSIDIALVDTKFEREKDGYELVREIKELTPQTTFVLLVNALEKPDVELMNKLGIFGYLTKPIDSRKLFQVISEIQESTKKSKPEKRKRKSEENEISESYEFEDKVDRQIPTLEIDEVETEKYEKKINSVEGIRGIESKGKVSEEEREGTDIQERKDISSSWTGELVSKSLEELFVVMQAIKDMFGGVKQMRQEAESYIKDMASLITELKRKIIEIPDSEEIISKVKGEIAEIIQAKVLEEVYGDIESRILAKLKDELKKYTAEIKGELQAIQSSQQNKTPEEEISKLKTELLNYINGIISNVKEQIISEIPTLQIFESIKGDIKKILEEINIIKTEREKAITEKEKPKEEFISVDDIEEAYDIFSDEKKTEEESDFISFTEI